MKPINKISSINICGIFKNNANYLKSFFVPMMNKLIVLHEELDFYFYFFVDVGDDDTDDVLRRFVKGKKGSQVKVDSRPGKKYKRGTDLLRIKNIERARNELLHLRPYEGDVTMFVDSDVFFDMNLINRFLLREYPTDTAQVSCNGKDHVTCQAHRGQCKHYYDTLALIDMNTKLGYNFTRTNGFQCCPFEDQTDRDNWFAGKLVQVKSAFGGVSFYRTNIINNTDLKYNIETHIVYVHDKSDLFCEHWDFNRKIQQDGEFKIFVDPKLIVCNLEV